MKLYEAVAAGTIQVDEDILEKYGRYVIGIGPKKQVQIFINRKSYLLHKLILRDVPEIDHKDTNPCNNTRLNLRPATSSQNNQNQKIGSRNKSGYKGVSWNKKSGKWCAQIQVDGVNFHIGFYVDKVEAAKAYNREATIQFGEFARLNVIPELQEELQ